MPDFLNKASTCSNARLSRRGGPDAAGDLLDERVAGRFQDRLATSAGPRLTRSSFASTLSRPATSPRTYADASCTKRCWCGRRPSRLCPARRSWSSPGSGGRSRRWCSPRTLDSVAGNGRLATGDIAAEVARLVTSQVRAWCPSSAGRASPRPPSPRTLIDEYRQFVNPIILGGGTPYFTPLAKPLGLRLTESLTFSAGVVYLRCQRTR
jgi:hypothetical protein